MSGSKRKRRLFNPFEFFDHTGALSSALLSTHYEKLGHADPEAFGLNSLGRFAVNRNFPVLPVVSMGRRNTFLKFTRRSLKTQSLSWALI